jgi:nicotinamide mononucleotide transporter
MTNIFEIIGVVFGLVCVWLTMKQSIWSWPLGIINVSAFIVMFYQQKLYPDAVLHAIYLGLSVYGWFKWGQVKNDLPVTSISIEELVQWALWIPIASMITGRLFAQNSSSSAPYIDSTILVMSLTAQYLLARKILENWLLWIVSDVIAISLYSYKGLYTTAGLYFVYLLICINGYYSWKQKRV